ncbi:MBL fold metallo-hydrolase, partial [Aquabacterium sp.]|uniref:MBL fold metallo-hydrolase n=1 Tax=Aquabacterium sp. TaxID=1872578 RepID=UPI0035C76134
PTFTVTYVVHDPESLRAAIVDSVLDYDPASGRTSFSAAEAVLAYVKEKGLSVDWHLETHAHADHLSAAPYLQQKIGGKIAIGEHIVIVQETFGKLFNAGTDFMPDGGTARADFPGGDARALYRSIRRLLALPGDTRLFMCHDYLPEGRKDYVWETTVEAERKANVHIHEGVSEDEFVAMREARDATLDAPTLILPSLQVNIQGGKLPSPDAQGRAFLRLPINALGKHSPLPAELFE